MSKLEDKMPDFSEFKEQLSKSDRDFLESIGVHSNEDLMKIVEEIYEALGRPVAARNNEDSSDGECEDFEALDPFELPQVILFNDEPAYAYHIRIKLNDAPLPIWREVEVPSNISLEFFAHVVMIAMGWENEHLHQFKHKNTIFKNRACIEADDMFWGFASRRKVCDAEEYSVSMVFKEKGKRVRFEYDFGDDWEHDIWLKKIREYGPDEAPCIKILKGVGTCPPEDCGGIWGYEDILEIWGKKRKTTEERELLEWSGIEKDFNPEYFDIERVRECLCDLWESVL